MNFLEGGINKFIKFGLVGVLNTLINWIIFALLNFVGVYYIVANVIAYAIATANSYIWNSKWVFKYNGKYYMLSSGCTGWDPNVAEIAVADSIMGTWKTIGNPCTGPDADKTFYAQSTYVQPVIGKKDAYIAMFDRWKKKDLEDSRYVWLPVLIKDGKITIPWHEKWDFSIFDK